MRPICATLLVFLAFKEGSCRHPGRTVPWPALVSLENGIQAMPSDNPPVPDKMPDPPKGLRRVRRLAPWELAELPMLAGAERGSMSATNKDMGKMMHDAALKRDRRFAPWAHQTVAQMPQMPPMQIPDGMPQMPTMPDMSQMPNFQMPQGMPQMPGMSSGRKRRSPKDDKKDGKNKEKEQKPEEEEEKSDEKPKDKGKPK